MKLPTRIGLGLLLAIGAGCAKGVAPALAPLAMPRATMPTAGYNTPPAKPATSGKSPAKPKSTTDKKPASKPKVPVSKSPTDSAAPKPDNSVGKLMADIQASADRTQNFIATAASWCLPVGGQGEKEYAVVRYSFARPNQVAVDVLQSKEEGGVGAKIVGNGEPTLKVRTKILGMPIKVELPQTDKRLCNQRNYTFGDTAIEAWYRSMMDPQAQIKILGKMTLPNGKQGTMLQCISSQMKPQITKEVYGVDSQDFTPLLCQYYEGNTVVYEVQVKSLSMNVQLPADTFEL